MALSTLSKLSKLLWKGFVSAYQSLLILDTSLARIPLYLNVALQAVSCLPFRDPHMSLTYMPVTNRKYNGVEGWTSCLLSRAEELAFYPGNGDVVAVFLTGTY